MKLLDYFVYKIVSLIVVDLLILSYCSAVDVSSCFAIFCQINNSLYFVTCARNEEIVMPAEQVGLVRDNYLWKVRS